MTSIGWLNSIARYFDDRDRPIHRCFSEVSTPGAAEITQFEHANAEVVTHLS
jgi:hypothetical protein